MTFALHVQLQKRNSKYTASGARSQTVDTRDGVWRARCTSCVYVYTYAGPIAATYFFFVSRSAHFLMDWTAQQFHMNYLCFIYCAGVALSSQTVKKRHSLKESRIKESGNNNESLTRVCLNNVKR